MYSFGFGSFKDETIPAKIVGPMIIGGGNKWACPEGYVLIRDPAKHGVHGSAPRCVEAEKKTELQSRLVKEALAKGVPQQSTGWPSVAPVDGTCPTGYRYIPSQPIPGTKGKTLPRCVQEAQGASTASVRPASAAPRSNGQPTIKPIDALVQFLEQARADRIAARLPVKAQGGKCPSGYRQTPVTLATGAWCHPCAEGEKLVELQSGEYRCAPNEALAGVAPCAEGMMPVKLRGPGDGAGAGVVIVCAKPEVMLKKSAVPGVDAEKRKPLSPAAWIAILGGGGILVGGALVGIGVAVARRRRG